jgi:redox-sensitive bicupin YhaK (pirin superfamily)
MTTPAPAPDGARPAAAVITAREVREGAGVVVRRSIGGRELDHLDPFLLLDEFRSDDAADYIAGFPDHPHRGFETVTYMLAGAMEHRDHAGNVGHLAPGSVQWMTAGRGIVHSEMPRQEQGLMWGFQLWVNLPAAQKMTAPRYQDIPQDRIPEVEIPGGTVRVIAGELGGVRGAVSGIATDPVYLDVRLDAGGQLEHALPREHNAFVYVYEGSTQIGDGAARAVQRGQLAVLGPGARARLAAPSAPARALLVAARPLGEPLARYGPFVMNTRQEIMQALTDFSEGRLG